MENWDRWDKFLKEIVVDYKLSRTEQDFFLERFRRQNLNLDEKEVCILVRGDCDISWEAYKKCRASAYRKFREVLTDANDTKKEALLKWLEEKYSSQKNETVKSLEYQNPFTPLSGAIADPNLFFGRDKEIREIFETLNSGSSVAIIGESGLGKSSLLKAIERTAVHKSDIKPIYIDLRHLQSDDDFYAELCNEIGIKICQGRELRHKLKPYRILLLLDVVDNMRENWFTNQVRSQLRALADGSDPPLRLVVAASQSLDTLFLDSQNMTSPFENICREHRLKPWNQETVKNFINSRLTYFVTQQLKCIQFDENEIIKIYQETGGHPQKVMQQCHDLYKYLNENNEK
ncbi:AAA family ATPase [Lyngbya sp. CCY1209]|uniref:nSTAND1 domain-containing NTPase n=1 Tax=Lyngbya sp. CCY1209 TaxID=2886103 RepID=UPI002D2162C4|nr:AAA family ATPase [Lyngbya sp. CCY1209]MEB3882504.1 AAA family ATPase [Lyngbya sp. CCY1209]